MAFAYSTIAQALLPTTNSFALTSATGVTASNYQGAGTATNPGTGTITYLLVEQEIMQIVSISGTTVSVKRGMMGTRSMAHPTLTPFTFGLNSDFLNFVPAIKAFSIVQPESGFLGASAAIASSASIIAPGPLFHVTGTTTITNMQPPTSALQSNTGPNSEENYVNGFRVTIIFDSTAKVASGGGGTGVAFASSPAANVAATFQDFILDASSGTALWYPSRNSA
jgi:hypothetical protein